jgi:hypothetical protein
MSRAVTTPFRYTIKAFCLVSLISFTSASVLAESIKIPLGYQGQALNIETPRTGATKNQVEEKFGQPMKTSGPVGHPPISTWEYDNFTVYFEYNHVIHSVVKAPPK